MSILETIPEEDLTWDSYYRIYYDNDDEFVTSENQNTIYTIPMAEGGWDNETPVLDHDIDHDDDDDDDDTTSPPGPPGAASTPYRPGDPYHPGEEHEMTTLPQEQSGVVHGPGEPAWNSLTFIYRDASATDLEAFYDPKKQRLKVKMAGAGKASYYLFTTEKGTNIERLNPKLPVETRKALGESTLDQASKLQQERDRNSQEIREKTQTKQQLEEAAQNVRTFQQDMEAIRNQLRQLADEIRELEDRAGPLDEEAIQKLKDEKKALEEEHQRKREQRDQAYAAVQRALKLQTEINDLKLANRDLDRQINKLGVKVVKPLEELEQEKATLEKQRAEKQRVVEHENASPSEREAAKKVMGQMDRALERITEDMGREEEKLPLRERVKNIFKKHGWTIQAVALAVGIVLSALALAATNALKAGTKAVGKGLQAIGKKLGSLLPGLIGSIVSFIFKAAGQVFSFLAEHAWLLILAVVAFFMERLLKKRRR